MELRDVRPDAAELGGGGAGFGFEEFEAVDNGANGTAAFAGNLGNGKFLDEVEPEDGVEGGRFSAATGVEVVEDHADATGEVLIERVFEVGGEGSEQS